MNLVKIIHYKELYEIIESHSGFWDHPLSGFVKLNGKRLWFEWEYDTEVVRIYKLNWNEHYLKLWRRFLFNNLVGKHCMYRNGKRVEWFSMKKHWWIKYTFKLYYHSKLFRKVTLLDR